MAADIVYKYCRICGRTEHNMTDIHDNWEWLGELKSRND